MTDNTRPRDEELFMILTMHFQQAAMIGMGKLVNPATNKTQRDLPQAQFAIAMLEMFERRMQGNLSDQEQNFLQKTLTDLRLNYVEESGRPEPRTEEPAADEDAAAKPGEESDTAGTPAEDATTKDASGKTE